MMLTLSIASTDPVALSPRRTKRTQQFLDLISRAFHRFLRLRGAM
jgi:hypothetical protein